MWLDRKERGGLQEQMAIGWISTAELFLVSMMLMLAFALFLNTRLRDGDKQKEAESRRAAEAEKLAGEAMAKAREAQDQATNAENRASKAEDRASRAEAKAEELSAVVEKHERRQLEEQERILRPLETAELVVRIFSEGLPSSLDLDLYVQDPNDRLCYWHNPRIVSLDAETGMLISSEDMRGSRGGDLLLEGAHQLGQALPGLLHDPQDLGVSGIRPEGAPRFAGRSRSGAGANSGRPCRTRLSWTPSVRSRS